MWSLRLSRQRGLLTVKDISSAIRHLPGIFSIQREYNGKLQLKKVSADTSVTKDNGCYSLTDAKYGVYSDAGCTKQETVLTVKEDGSTDGVELRLAGTM